MSNACTPPSRYLAYLPGIYHGDGNDFFGRFLCIFEHLLQPVEWTVGEIAAYFDPSLTPEEFLPWLASWIGLVVDEKWSIETQRILIRHGVEIYRWRGTAHGLHLLLKLSTGAGSKVVVNDQIKDSPFEFTVKLTIPEGIEIDKTIIEAIIDAQKPAYTRCLRLDIKRSEASSKPGGEGG